MDEGFYRRFGSNLRQARKAAGLSQADLALAISLNRTSVSNIEKGRQKVLLHTFGELLRVLNVQPGDLLPAPATRPASSLSRLSGLAHDERDFIRRGLPELNELYKEEHGSSLDADSKKSKGAAGGT